tara:strand:+ start:201 stop:623 length:423 start_codon:yes stop_codon:yes gene_type:complete
MNKAIRILAIVLAIINIFLALFGGVAAGFSSKTSYLILPLILSFVLIVYSLVILLGSSKDFSIFGLSFVLISSYLSLLIVGQIFLDQIGWDSLLSLKFFKIGTYNNGIAKYFTGGHLLWLSQIIILPLIVFFIRRAKNLL